MRRPRARLLVLLAALLAAASCTNLSPEPGSEDGGNGRAGGATPRLRLDDHGAVGSLGPALLGRAVPRAAVEIDATDGASMTDPARGALAAALKDFGGKAVTFQGSDTVPSRDVYSNADLRRLEGAHRSTRSSASAASIYVLVLSGRHTDESALGVSFEASSFAIFPDQIASGLLPTLTYDTFEEAVVLHELGHLFGLVNLAGKGKFHEDPDHEGHSRNRDSVMYWAVEDVSIGNVFRGGPPRDFDGDDRTEMDRIRG